MNFVRVRSFFIWHIWFRAVYRQSLQRLSHICLALIFISVAALSHCASSGSGSQDPGTDPGTGTDPNADPDNDGIINSVDIDDDGDGLIEIGNLDMLTNVRYDLDGSHYDTDEEDPNDDQGNNTGCPTVGAEVRCSGYELIRDLSFVEADSYAGNSINTAWRPTNSNPATAANPGWMPIGDNSDNTDSTRFTAAFEGNGYSIRNLYVRIDPDSGNAYAGLFGYVGNGATVRNLAVVEVYVLSFSSSFTSNAGGLAGQNSGSISNSWSQGYISSFSSSFTSNAGGLAGQNSGSISNSWSQSYISSVSSSSNSGGLVGVNSGSISNSYAAGSASSLSTFSRSYSGALVGFNDNGSIDKAYATGSVSAFSRSASGVAYAGGLVGFISSGSINRTYATGSVSAFVVSGDQAGKIESGGDVDCFKLVVTESGMLTVFTTGSLNTVGVLEDGSSGTELADDDDSGTDSNFQIRQELNPGTYFVKVSSFERSTGSYTIHADFMPTGEASIALDLIAVADTTVRSYAGGLIGWWNSGSISNSYWDTESALLREDSSGTVTTPGGDLGNNNMEHEGVTALTTIQMQKSMGTGLELYPNALDDEPNSFDLGSNSEYPVLLYAENADNGIVDCKTPGSQEADDPNVPSCGNSFSRQAVHMASGFLRFSNTKIGTPSVVDPIFFYEIDNTTLTSAEEDDSVSAAVEITGTGINGTTAGSYAIEDASGTALTGYSFSSSSGNSTLTLPALNAGDEFYLSVTFTKDDDSFTQRYRFKYDTSGLAPLPCQGQDTDNDGDLENDDVDDDDDGLIEICDLDELNNLRYDLDGSHYDTDEEDTSAGHHGYNIGCPQVSAEVVSARASAEVGTVIRCSGYELIRDLNFAEANNYASGSVNIEWRSYIVSSGRIVAPDLAANPGWIPIGDNSDSMDSTRFTAIFDGNGYSIKNLYVRTSDHAGLFGYLGTSAVLRNVAVVDAYVFSSSNSGGLVGENSGSIINSYATGAVSSSSNSGGLVGENNGSIISSYATASISSFSSASSPNSGGLVGENGSGSIINSYATGAVSAFSSAASSTSNSGGLVGENSGSIINAYATGSVSAFSSDASTTSNSGGLVGENSSGSMINNSYATGSSAASAAATATSNSGGLVGENSGSIVNAYWDRNTSVIMENSVVVSAEDQDTGDDGDHASVRALSSQQMQAIMDTMGMPGTFPALADMENSFDLGSDTEYPFLLYAKGCENITSPGSDDPNVPNCNDLAPEQIACETLTSIEPDDPNVPNCGDPLPGQAVRMASGFLRYSNTTIGTPAAAASAFFDINDTATSIAITGTGVSGTTAGSYAIEDVSGTALRGYRFSSSSGNSTLIFPALDIGDEFYLSAIFTKDDDSFTQRYRFKK